MPRWAKVWPSDSCGCRDLPFLSLQLHSGVTNCFRSPALYAGGPSWEERPSLLSLSITPGYKTRWPGVLRLPEMLGNGFSVVLAPLVLRQEPTGAGTVYDRTQKLTSFQIWSNLGMLIFSINRNGLLSKPQTIMLKQPLWGSPSGSRCAGVSVHPGGMLMMIHLLKFISTCVLGTRVKAQICKSPF